MVHQLVRLQQEAVIRLEEALEVHLQVVLQERLQVERHLEVRRRLDHRHLEDLHLEAHRLEDRHLADHHHLEDRHRLADHHRPEDQEDHHLVVIPDLDGQLEDLQQEVHCKATIQRCRRCMTTLEVVSIADVWSAM